MSEQQPWDYILSFIKDPHNPENQVGHKIFMQVFFKEFYKYDLLVKYSEPEDLFHEFITTIIFKGKSFTLNPVIAEKMEDPKTKIVSYLYKTIHNFLRTKRREAYKNLQIEPIDKGTEGKQEEPCFNHIIDPVIEIEALEIKEIILKTFSEKEIRVLCYSFLNDKEYFDEELSDDAIYKRKSRMKKFLQDFVKEYGFSLEGFACFIDKYLKSDICDKLR